jgi:hypothetical protein
MVSVGWFLNEVTPLALRTIRYSHLCVSTKSPLRTPCRVLNPGPLRLTCVFTIWLRPHPSFRLSLFSPVPRRLYFPALQ